MKGVVSGNAKIVFYDENGTVFGDLNVFVGVTYKAVRVAAVLEYAKHLGQGHLDCDLYTLSFEATGEDIDPARQVIGDAAVVLR